VPDSAATTLQQPANNVESALTPWHQLRTEALEARNIQEFGVDTGQAHSVAPAGETGQVVFAKCQLHHAARTVHHVIVEFLRKSLPAS
jgi:hypothetical protein